MKYTIQLGNATAVAGSTAKGALDVTPMADGGMLSLPVIIANGRSEGPVLWINAALHGNEYNGVVAALRIMNELDVEQLHGAVICTPISNPLAFYSKNRLSQQDGLNLGECYPGDPDGQLTQRIAYVHFNAIKKYANILIDFHASGVTHRARPYSVFKRCGYPEVEKKIEELLKYFGIYLNCGVDTLKKTDEPVKLVGSLDIECSKLGIPSFMLEVGNATRVENDIVDFSVAGTRNIMQHLGMLEGTAKLFSDSIFLTARKILRCGCGGIVVQKKNPYDFVHTGELISVVMSPYGEILEEVRAPRDLYILSLKEDAVVQAGERVAFVGLVD